MNEVLVSYGCEICKIVSPHWIRVDRPRTPILCGNCSALCIACGKECGLYRLSGLKDDIEYLISKKIKNTGGPKLCVCSSCENKVNVRLVYYFMIALGCDVPIIESLLPQLRGRILCMMQSKNSAADIREYSII